MFDKKVDNYLSCVVKMAPIRWCGKCSICMKRYCREKFVQRKSKTKFPLDEDREPNCPECEEPKKDLKKVVELVDSGLRVYNFCKCRELIQPNVKLHKDDMIIIHNTKSREILRSDYIDELSKCEINKCCKCNPNLQKAFDYLKTVNIIKQNEVIGICQHCQSGKTTGTSNCKKCDESLKRFLLCKVTKHEENQMQLGDLVKKVEGLLLSALETAELRRPIIEDSKSLRELKKLLREPKESRSLNIDVFPPIARYKYRSRDGALGPAGYYYDYDKGKYISDPYYTPWSYGYDGSDSATESDDDYETKRGYASRGEPIRRPQQYFGRDYDFESEKYYGGKLTDVNRPPRYAGSDHEFFQRSQHTIKGVDDRRRRQYDGRDYDAFDSRRDVRRRAERDYGIEAGGSPMARDEMEERRRLRFETEYEPRRHLLTFDDMMNRKTRRPTSRGPDFQPKRDAERGYVLEEGRSRGDVRRRAERDYGIEAGGSPMARDEMQERRRLRFETEYEPRRHLLTFDNMMNRKTRRPTSRGPNFQPRRDAERGYVLEEGRSIRSREEMEKRRRQQYDVDYEPGSRPQTFDERIDQQSRKPIRDADLGGRRHPSAVTFTHARSDGRNDLRKSKPKKLSERTHVVTARQAGDTDEASTALKSSKTSKKESDKKSEGSPGKKKAKSSEKELRAFKTTDNRDALYEGEGIRKSRPLPPREKKLQGNMGAPGQTKGSEGYIGKLLSSSEAVETSSSASTSFISSKTSKKESDKKSEGSPGKKKAKSSEKELRAFKTTDNRDALYEGEGIRKSRPLPPKEKKLQGNMGAPGQTKGSEGYIGKLLSSSEAVETSSSASTSFISSKKDKKETKKKSEGSPKMKKPKSSELDINKLRKTKPRESLLNIMKQIKIPPKPAKTAKPLRPTKILKMVNFREIESVDSLEQEIVVSKTNRPNYRKEKIKGNEVILIKRDNVSTPDKTLPFEVKAKSASAPVNVISGSMEPYQYTEGGKTAETEHKEKSTEGVVMYELSNKKFIAMGWTKLPRLKKTRQVDVYHAEPTDPQSDWFLRHITKGPILYDTCETLAEINEDGSGKLFYRNGNVALEYLKADVPPGARRHVVYSHGDLGSAPVVLASFDYLGNAAVYDPKGNVRLQFNQFEGCLIDSTIGPPSKWKWHTLNDNPTIHDIYSDTILKPKDLNLEKLIEKFKKVQETSATSIAPLEEDMLEIEYLNYLKAEKKLQKYKALEIRTKVLKLNCFFSLKVIDQAHVYLTFSDRGVSIKFNLGIKLDCNEILGTNMIDAVGVVMLKDRRSVGPMSLPSWSEPRPASVMSDCSTSSAWQ